jgi:hypothetical protein
MSLNRGGQEGMTRDHRIRHNLSTIAPTTATCSSGRSGEKPMRYHQRRQFTFNRPVQPVWISLLCAAALVLTGCPPSEVTQPSVAQADVPPTVFTLYDEVMAVSAQGEDGTSFSAEIALTPLRAKMPGLSEVTLAEYDSGRVTEIPFTPNDTNIVATVVVPKTYLVFAKPAGRIEDIYFVLCRLNKHRSEIELLRQGLTDSLCKLILCTPESLLGSDAFTAFPELAPLRGTLNIDNREIGGWGSAPSPPVCDRRSRFAGSGLIFPILRCDDVPVLPAGKVVNMIPSSLSGESNQDSEPFLAVDRSNPLNLAGTAFTPNPFGTSAGTAPVYLSTDGGSTWSLNMIVPSAGDVGTGDITVAGSQTAGRLYGGILRIPGDLLLNVLRSQAFTGPTVMTVQSSRTQVDQPFTQASLAGPTDRVYVGNNDFNASSGRSASVEVSTNGGTSFTTVRIETRSTAGQDGPSVRPAVARDGTAYVAYFGWRSFAGDIATSDVVVVRDDNGAAGANPFRALVDPSDNQAGRVVAAGVKIPWSNGPTLGFERIGSTLSIAVAPNNSALVYITWADRVGNGDIYTIHLRRSTDRGSTWSGDLRTIKNATCCAVAVSDSGTAGFLYQQLTGSGNGSRWVTHLEQSRDAFANTDDRVLATVPANAPPAQFLPYLGDYNFLLSVGGEFRGIFSANNTPDLADFPSGVRYQRPVDFTNKRLLDGSGNPVDVSIDPFYFSFPAIR